jgi:type III secretion protein O
MSVFQQLLKVKRFREHQAELRFVRERIHHELAEKNERAAEMALHGYRSEIQRAEKKMYDELCSRQVRQRDLEQAMQHVAAWRAGENARQQQRDEASQAREVSSNALAQARHVMQEAGKVARKFVELDHHESMARNQEHERSEDLEMEEAVAGRRDRSDWSDFEDRSDV